MSRTNALCFSLVAVLVVSRPIWSQDDSGRTLSPHFVVHGNGAVTEAFPLKSTHVAATIDGVIADVIVTQTYANEGAGPINARYVFPASTRASVHGMRIRIDDQIVVARIRERRKARVEFEKARVEGKSASLLEQQRPNVFTMDVANILPGDSVEVELHYTELLSPTEGTYEFVYPAVVGPRYSGRTEPRAPVLSRWVENPLRALVEPASSRPSETPATESSRWLRSPLLAGDGSTRGAFDISVTIGAGIPLQEVRSSSHPVDVAYDAGDIARVSLKPAPGSAGDRDFILTYRLAGERIQSGLLLHQGETENFFLLMVQPPERWKAASVAPREYVFILDVSGSMSGFPLDTAKFLISGLIGGLRDTDLFNIVLFAGGSYVMAPESVPATEENVNAAIRMICDHPGGGGTELVPALGRALTLPRREEFSRSIVVITDGYIEADHEVFEIIRANLARTNFFSFGIGSSVNRHLVEGIARAGLGEPFVVTRPEEATEAAEKFRAYVESPLLTDLHVTYDGFDAYDVEPAALPDLFAQRPIILFGKWRGRPQGDITITGNGITEPYSHTFRVQETEPVHGNGALGYLWARTRIARLSDLGLGREDARIESEITALGLGYSLLTKNTSFIAVIEQPRNTRADATDVVQPLPLPRGVSADAGYASGSEPELWILFAMAGLVMLLLRAIR